MRFCVYYQAHFDGALITQISWASWHATWLTFDGACCPPVVTFIHKGTNLSQGRSERHWILFLHTPINHPRILTHCFVLYSSELLHSLDMCENDPVAIAQCFVDKVRGKVPTVPDSVEKVIEKVNSSFPVFPQSDYFEIYTQYCTNYPK